MIENLLIAQLILVVILLLKEYLLSFAKEKGKNLATKQDIQSITNKIEEAKSFYNTKLETVKTSLQINAYEQNKIIEKSLDSLLAFYDTSLALIKDNLSRNFGDFAGENLGETLFEFQNQTHDLFIKQNVLYHRLLVFLGTEKEIIIKSAKLVDTSIRVRIIFKKYFGEIKMALVREAEAIKSTQEVWRSAVEQTNLHGKRYSDEVTPLFTELNNDLRDFIAVMISYLKRKNVLE